MTVRLLLFGSPAIESGGESFVLPFERRSQLLVFLALKRSWVGRVELAAMLWPEQGSKLAYANLRKTLFRLQSFPGTPGIEAQGGALRCEVETDVSDFELALRENRYADALALRRGELLVGFEDDRNEAWSGWLGFERDRLRVAWRGAALKRLDLDIDAGEGIELSARLLDADLLDESAMRMHMSWLARNGQSGRAREVYREFAERLEKELGIAPGAELKSLHDALGSAASAPISAALKESVAPDDGLIGRTVELRRITAFLSQDDCRLLSLIGPGGVGKTRLAQRVIQELASGYADGVVFVPLEDLVSASELGGRLAREIGIRLAGSAEPMDQVIAFLRERQMLLVLDNFEQLAADAAILERVLRQCARLKIIATSRVRLAISMEWTLPLHGLPYPEPEDLDHIEAFDAARLFIDSARRVEPSLVPAEQAAAIVEICQQLEGLPLALKLAAAWTRVLSCSAIADELRKGTELLRTVDTAHPVRHASIEVVFEQSWQLLTAAERDVLARLSVFRGGFSAEAARAIASASIPVLGALTDKSLLRKDGTRIVMHPLVQQLAAERLGHGESRESTERAHALHFHRLMIQLRRGVQDGDREAMEWVDTEFENCRIAWRWSVAHDDPDALAKSAATVLQFCDRRGRYAECLSLLNEAIESRAAQASAEFRALLLAKAAHLEYRLDRYGNAEAIAEQALAIARPARDHETLMQCLRVLGGCCLRRGRHEDAKRYFKQALREAPESGDPRSVAGALDNLSLVEKMLGHYGEALRLSLKSLLEHRRLGDAAGEALCLNNLGALYLATGDWESAGTQLRQGLAVSDRHGLASTRTLILANLTEVAINLDDPDAAAAYAKRALEYAEAARNRSVVSLLKLQFVRLALRRGDLAAARSELGASLEIAIAIGRPALLLSGVTCFAEILQAQGESDCARLILTFAADHPSSGAPERDEIRVQLARWRPAVSEELVWPGLELGELIHRIVGESGIAHASLIATLRGAH
jgi:predicted ATPase/DNA-binding SARP family transcriptional activator/Tfp pilus assembly protein PilF